WSATGSRDLGMSQPRTRDRFKLCALPGFTASPSVPSFAVRRVGTARSQPRQGCGKRTNRPGRGGRHHRMKPCRPFDAAQPGACDPALATRDDSEAPTVSTPLPPPDSAYGNGRERPPERVDEQRDRPRLGGNRPVEGLDGIGELAVLEPRLP